MSPNINSASEFVSSINLVHQRHPLASANSTYFTLDQFGYDEATHSWSEIYGKAPKPSFCSERFLYNKRKFHGRLEIRNLSSRVEKYFNRPQRSLVKYFSKPLCGHAESFI